MNDHVVALDHVAAVDHVVAVDHVSLTIKGATLLDDVSLHADAGEVVGVVGRNGSGKSVLFKCIVGLFVPQRGEITVDGVAIVGERRFPTSVGAIIEKPGFVGSMTAIQNLKVLASIRNRIREPEIMDALALVGLEHAAHKRVYKFSLGMLQRLDIAQAIMEKPTVVILDEPTNGLDESGVAMVRGLVRRLRDGGASILLASHQPQDIEELCDRVYVVERGRLQA